MTNRVSVPVLTLRNSDGSVDHDATMDYALRANATWLDLFIISGTIGLGETSSVHERRRILETWTNNVPADRLLACCWAPEDLAHARELGVRPLVVIQRLPDEAALLKLLSALPPESFIYSHPKYSGITFSSAIAHAANRGGFLPAGGKICKISLPEVQELRAVCGPEFGLYDGRCRHMARSIDAGATGVIAVPLCAIPADLPERTDTAGLQTMIDSVQSLIDSRPVLADRIAMLHQLLSDANLTFDDRI